LFKRGNKHVMGGRRLLVAFKCCWKEKVLKSKWTKAFSKKWIVQSKT
jgi:hypothetical protein